MASSAGHATGRWPANVYACPKVSTRERERGCDGLATKGGAELALWTSIPRELIVVIQALVILFTGALDNMVRMPLERFFLARRRAAKPKTKLTPAE